MILLICVMIMRLQMVKLFIATVTVYALLHYLCKCTQIYLMMDLVFQLYEIGK